MDIQQGIILYLILVGSIAFHEWAHAYSADKLGDPTPASQGRVTLNPIAHMDPIGTGLIPLVMIFMAPGIAIFGWGRPVQINLSNFERRTRDHLIVTMAGPASNLVVCIVTLLVGAVIFRITPEGGASIYPLLVQIIMLNSILIIFNLLPIPPLDGSHVMRYAVGMTEETYFKLASWGFIVLLVLINIPAFRIVFSGIIHATTGFFVNLMLMLGGMI